MSQPTKVEIGPATLYCADAREIVNKGWEFAADVMVTDPPFGMGLRSGWNGALGDLSVIGDGDTEARDAVLSLWGQFPALVFGRWSIPRPPATRMILTWDKGGNTGMGDLSLPWKPQTEEIYVLGAGFVGNRDSCVLAHTAPSTSLQNGRRHQTEKPLSLMMALLAKCPPHWTVIDPFMGSGTTGVAAAKLGRKFIGVEIDPDIYQRAVRRIADVVNAGTQTEIVP